MLKKNNVNIKKKYRIIFLKNQKNQKSHIDFLYFFKSNAK